ncbi:hypothetical protein BJV78DRAFT_1157114 [Lactifluus subvellereus]|nr:hypothetical protein BJV78DRAFT_1157114 [Lactifluus subvellereus]
MNSKLLIGVVMIRTSNIKRGEMPKSGLGHGGVGPAQPPCATAGWEGKDVVRIGRFSMCSRGSTRSDTVMPAGKSSHVDRTYDSGFSFGSWPSFPLDSVGAIYFALLREFSYNHDPDAAAEAISTEGQQQYALPLAAGGEILPGCTTQVITQKNMVAPCGYRKNLADAGVSSRRNCKAIVRRRQMLPSSSPVVAHGGGSTAKLRLARTCQGV